MMPDDELATLAEDIKQNGQVHPIIISDYEGEEVLLDGRNRLRACEIAGVKPTFKKLNGEDQKAFILSVNINRRHMTVGQRTMAVAMVYPTPARLRTKGSGAATASRLNPSYLACARNVLARAPNLAKAVVSGAITLSEADKRVGDERRALERTEANMARIRAEAPDLAELVVEEKLEGKPCLRWIAASMKRGVGKKPQRAFCRTSLPQSFRAGRRQPNGQSG
jgi:hypothetical protein